MRIYHSQDGQNTFLVFRPTQQDAEGQGIHDNRRMAYCQFLPMCKGRIHERFQEAFLSLIEDEQWKMYLQGNLFTAGHSLGGSLQLLMALYLRHALQRLPNMSFGFAGPFIGNKYFSEEYLTDFRLAMNERWWQVETVNASNPLIFDGTVEQYQVANDRLYIVKEGICGFPIHPLPVPEVSYGMHDLKQYQLFLRGCDCYT